MSTLFIQRKKSTQLKQMTASTQHILKFIDNIFKMIEGTNQNPRQTNPCKQQPFIFSKFMLIQKIKIHVSNCPFLTFLRWSLMQRWLKRWVTHPPSIPACDCSRTRTGLQSCKVQTASLSDRRRLVPRLPPPTGVLSWPQRTDRCRGNL